MTASTLIGVGLFIVHIVLFAIIVQITRGLRRAERAQIRAEEARAYQI